jgi:hypothetical protein
MQLPPIFMIANRLYLWHFLPITSNTVKHPLGQACLISSGYIIALGLCHTTKFADTGPRHTRTEIYFVEEADLEVNS